MDGLQVLDTIPPIDCRNGR